MIDSILLLIGNIITVYDDNIQEMIQIIEHVKYLYTKMGKWVSLCYRLGYKRVNVMD